MTGETRKHPFEKIKEMLIAFYRSLRAHRREGFPIKWAFFPVLLLANVIACGPWQWDYNVFGLIVSGATIVCLYMVCRTKDNEFGLLCGDHHTQVKYTFVIAGIVLFAYGIVTCLIRIIDFFTDFFVGNYTIDIFNVMMTVIITSLLIPTIFARGKKWWVYLVSAIIIIDGYNILIRQVAGSDENVETLLDGTEKMTLDLKGPLVDSIYLWITSAVMIISLVAGYLIACRFNRKTF